MCIMQAVNLNHFAITPRPSRLIVAAVLVFCAFSAGGRTTAQPLENSPSAAKFAPASVKAAPDLKCKLHLANSSASGGVTVYTDEDGYARFHAVKTSAESPDRRHVLTCSNEAGQVSTFAVDLAASDTFASRPFDVARARGVDRPALTGDPQSYSQAQLAQQGYGLRPRPTDLVAYRAWLDAATKPGRILFAKKQGEKLSHTVTTSQGPPWIGTVMTGSAPYDSIISTFVVPTAQPGAWGTAGTAAVIWPGLGGFNTRSGLIQAGVGIFTTATTAVYTTWREYCCGDPDGPPPAGAFTPAPGDKILAQVWYCDANGQVSLNGGYGCSYVYDYNSQAVFSCTAPRGQPSASPCWSVKALPACSASPTTPNCMTFGNSAETILENTSQQLTPPTDQFPPFAPSLVMSALAGTTAGKAVTLDDDPTVILLTDFPHNPPPVTVAIASDQTSFTIGPPADSDPFGYSFIDQKTGLTEQHNIFRATDAHVHAVWFNFASGWHQEDRSTFAPGVPPAVGNPFGYAFVNQTTGLTEQHNLFVSADGHIHALWFNFAKGWHHEDRTAFFPDAPPSRSNPRGYAFVDEATGLTEQHNIYRSADGHIHAFWFNFATGWHHEDRTALVPGVPPAAGDPWGYAFVNEKTGLAEQHILFRSADGHIHALWFNFSQGWHHEDRTALLPGVPPAVGNPFGYAFVNQTTGLTEQHNLFVSADGHVHALWFNFSNGWHHEDRTAMLPNVPPSVSDPWGYPFVNENTGLTEQHNLFRSADGHIHALWFNFSQGWHQEDRSIFVPGVPPAVGNPTGYAFVNETTGLTEQHNLFRLGNGSIAALWFNFSGGWHYEVRY